MNENEENGSFYRDMIDDLEEENYPLEDPPTFWNAEKKTLWERIRGRSETPFVLIGIGLVLVVAAFFMFFPRGGESDALLDADGLSDRLQQIEDRIGAMETAMKELSFQKEDMELVKKAVLRFDETDASMSARIQSLAEDLASLQKEMEGINKPLPASPKTSAEAPAAPKTSAEASVAQKTETAPQAAYHEVSSGDTLYSIGRRYGVSVDEIRKLNGLSAQDAIHPGQKLKLKE